MITFFRSTYFSNRNMCLTLVMKIFSLEDLFTSVRRQMSGRPLSMPSKVASSVLCSLRTYTTKHALT